MADARIDKDNLMNVSSIETFFDGLLRGSDKLTNNLFFNTLPTTIKKEWDRLAVVDAANPLSDFDAYGRMTVLVYLYAKQSPYGTKNVKVLQEMEKKLNELILGNTDTHYHIHRRGNYSNYDAVNDIYYNIIQINLIIT